MRHKICSYIHSWLLKRRLHSPLKISGIIYNTAVFSSSREETRSRGYASTRVVNSCYDYNNRHHEQVDNRGD